MKMRFWTGFVTFLLLLIGMVIAACDTGPTTAKTPTKVVTTPTAAGEQVVVYALDSKYGTTRRTILEFNSENNPFAYPAAGMPLMLKDNGNNTVTIDLDTDAGLAPSKYSVTMQYFFTGPRGPNPQLVFPDDSYDFADVGLTIPYTYDAFENTVTFATQPRSPQNATEHATR